MEIKSYLDELNGGHTAEQNMKTLADGRRVRENVQTVKLDDGTEEHTHEILEEVVPMRVTKRIQRKMQPVSVEERVECIAEDGTVTTQVRTINPDLLDLNREPTTLEEVAHEVRSLHAALDCTQRLASAAPSKKKVARKRGLSFLSRARAKYGKGRRPLVEDGLADDTYKTLPDTTVVVEEEEVEVSQSKWFNVGLSTLAWIAFAVVAALVTYALI